MFTRFLGASFIIGVLGLQPGAVAQCRFVHKRLSFALGCYAVLALLAWFTLGSAGFYVGGRLVQMRTAVCIFLGGLTLKTLIAHKAGW